MATTSRRLSGGRVRLRVRGHRRHPGVEAMESRTLLASGLAIATTAASPPAVLVASGQRLALQSAVATLFRDLAAAYGPGGTGATSVTAARLQADLDQIAQLTGANSNSSAVQGVQTSLASIAQSGAITTQNRQVLVQNLQGLLVNFGISAQFLNTTALQALPSGNAASASKVPDDLTDPNLLGSGQGIFRRGQGSSPGNTAIPSPGTTSPVAALPGSGLLGAGFRRLMNDLGSALAGSRWITPTQKVDLRRDLAAVTASAHRPSEDAIAAMKADLAALGGGALSDESRTAIGRDFAALLHSAGVSDALVARTQGDLAPVLNASDLDPTALQTVLTDLLNVLSARPQSTASPFGAWWIGGRPR